MKLWFDEDLSHTLVQVAAEFDLHATCNRDRGMLGSKDPLLAATAIGEEYVFVTDNRVDFRKLYDVPREVHPGLMFIPGTGSRALQQDRTRIVIQWMRDEAARCTKTLDDLLVNKLVEMDEHGVITIEWLPGE